MEWSKAGSKGEGEGKGEGMVGYIGGGRGG